MCLGDCNGDGRVTIDDVVRAVGVLLGGNFLATCSACDANGDGRITVDELVRAVGNLLSGCATDAQG